MDTELTVRSLLDVGAADAPALFDVDGRILTYGALRAQVDELAAELAARGVGPTDRVAILLPNGPAMAVAFLAAASRCAVAPLNPAYRVEELRFSFEDLAPRVLITTVEAGVAAREALPAGMVALDMTGDLDSGFALVGPEVDAGLSSDAPATAVGPTPDDAALLLHTSGTTAKPKLVALTQRNLVASATNIARWLELTPADRCLNVMPLSRRPWAARSLARLPRTRR
ncbi:MAG: AMP-binding protein [Chloroflexi bacterium]|nr:AMP-binding protein [Chloroflexota bacterium]MDA1145880.1 AMP-binding protein [Chloroflexota bacterium]